jgi:hypothetical protein
MTETVLEAAASEVGRAWPGALTDPAGVRAAERAAGAGDGSDGRTLDEASLGDRADWDGGATLVAPALEAADPGGGDGAREAGPDDGFESARPLADPCAAAVAGADDPPGAVSGAVAGWVGARTASSVFTDRRAGPGATFAACRWDATASARSSAASAGDDAGAGESRVDDDLEGGANPAASLPSRLGPPPPTGDCSGAPGPKTGRALGGVTVMAPGPTNTGSALRDWAGATRSTSADSE